jgi:hypothetical protein
MGTATFTSYKDLVRVDDSIALAEVVMAVLREERDIWVTKELKCKYCGAIGGFLVGTRLCSYSPALSGLAYYE